MRMRRKRKLDVDEKVDKQFGQNEKRKFKTNNKEKLNTCSAKNAGKTPDIDKTEQTVERRRKKKKVDNVSEYFANGNQDKQTERSVRTKKKKRKQDTVEKDKADEVCEMKSGEENEFEESDVTYSSPAATKASKLLAKMRNRDNERDSSNKQSARSKEEGKNPPHKRKYKGSEKSIQVKKTKHDGNVEEEINKKKETYDKQAEENYTASKGKDSYPANKDTDEVVDLKPKGRKTKQSNSSDKLVNGGRKKQGVKPERKTSIREKKKDTSGKSTDMILEPENTREPSAMQDKKILPKCLDHTDVTAVLLHMEGITKNTQISKPSTSRDATVMDADIMSDSDDSDPDSLDNPKNIASDGSGEDDWEEVADHHGNSPRKSQIPDQPVEFTLDAPLVNRKRQKKEFDWKTYLRRKMNRFRKEVAMEIHKVHLLCLTARCLYLQNVYHTQLLCAQAFSVVLVTRELTVSPKKCTLDQLGKVVAWLRQTYTDKTRRAGDEKLDDRMSLRLGRCLQDQCATNQQEFVFMCVLLLRQVGFNTRLVMSLQPLPFKETTTKTSQDDPSSRKSNTTKGNKVKKQVKASTKVVKEKMKSSNTKTKNKSDNLPKGKKDLSSKEKSVKTKKDSSKLSAGKRRSGRRYSKDLPKDVYKDGDNVADSEEEYDPNADRDSEVENEDKKNLNKKGKAEKKRESEDSENTMNESDSDFEEESILFRTQSLKRTSPASKNKKVLSSDSDSSLETSKGADEWIEVYLEKEHRWICIDCVTGRLDKPYDIERIATQPVTYIIGINNDGHLKDVTQRYANQWLTSTRKLRVDADWWEETLAPYKSSNLKLDKQEDEEIQAHLQKRPLPTSISDFKSHPLYALQRHLLKFEAIYPPSAVPLGYIRGEPVFARECVYTLHSRENWLKEGRAVRLGEEAYKYVKSRPKWNKPKENPDAKDLEVFGIWQTEIYIPPPAVDGKVPRNAHGNVEMFLPSMLPGGTVHLKLPGLNKVAKKLDIDCAPAMIGWDHHCGFSHPLMDGWIVCEEFKDILLAAWDEEQEIIKEKEAARREKRVYDNWRKLIRGLLIRERLKQRFDFESDKKPGEPSTAVVDKKVTSDSVKTKTETVAEKATDSQHAWPQNRLKTQVTAYKLEEL